MLKHDCSESIPGKLTRVGSAILVLVASCKQADTGAPEAITSTHVREIRAQAELERLDTRTPLPLLPMMANHQKQNMRDHLVAVQEIVQALSRGDFPAVTQAASRIGSSEEMGRMCTHMGAGAVGFTEQALAFHRTADTIAEAAKTNDAGAVMLALDHTLQACVSCHASFRQQVVDGDAWTALRADPKR